MRIFFIINGGRAPVSAAVVDRLRRVLDNARADYRLEISKSIDDAKRLVALAAAEGYDTLWIGGGDGTIHVLLNQSMPAHLNLGVVPMGTVNALARALGIPMKPEDAVRFLLKARPRPMNIGCVNGERLFLCFAGVGFDAAVVHDVGGAFKRIGGRLAYLAAGAVSIFALRRIVPFEVEFHEGVEAGDGEEVCEMEQPAPSAVIAAAAPASANAARAANNTVAATAGPATASTATTGSRSDTATPFLSLQAFRSFMSFTPTSTAPPPRDHGYSFVLSNIRNYAGFDLFPDAHPCANAMEMWLFRHRRIDAMAAWSAATMFGISRIKRHLRRDVGHYLVRSFTVTSQQPMYLQLDGEAVRLGDGTRYDFEYQPNAVSVLTAPEDEIRR